MRTPPFSIQPTPMRIETATSFSLDDCVALVAVQFKEHGIGLTNDALREALDVLIVDSKRGEVLLAYDPEPIGVAVLAYTWTLEHGGLSAWLDELFVVAEQRNRGVGAALLRQALDVARRAGCRAVDLEIDAAHERAGHLYERQGFDQHSRSRWVKHL